MSILNKQTHSEGSFKNVSRKEGLGRKTKRTELKVMLTSHPVTNNEIML